MAGPRLERVDGVKPAGQTPHLGAVDPALPKAKPIDGFSLARANSFAGSGVNPASVWTRQVPTQGFALLGHIDGNDVATLEGKRAGIVSQLEQMARTS